MPVSIGFIKRTKNDLRPTFFKQLYFQTIINQFFIELEIV